MSDDLTDDQVSYLRECAAARRLEWRARVCFPWCYPPESDVEDARREREGKGPREWEPTRALAIETTLKRNLRGHP